jgi:hypothetical protein
MRNVRVFLNKSHGKPWATREIRQNLPVRQLFEFPEHLKRMDSCFCRNDNRRRVCEEIKPDLRLWVTGSGFGSRPTACGLKSEGMGINLAIIIGIRSHGKLWVTGLLFDYMKTRKYICGNYHSY